MGIIHHKVFDNIDQAKLKFGYWHKIPKTVILDEKFIEGFAYYIGDGRNKTNRGLSTINEDVKIIIFFIKWLKKYFNVNLKDLKINILTNNSSFDSKKILNDFSEKLNIDRKYINSISKKYGARSHHKLLIEVTINRSILKLIFDLLIPKVKEICLKDKNLAAAYIRGIMAAEGSPNYNLRKGSKSVYVKMKDKKEINYIEQLLNLLSIETNKIHYSKNDNEWVVYVSSMDELGKLTKIDIFKLSKKRKEKFDYLLSNFKRRQVKKGTINKFYLNAVNEFKEITAPELAKNIKRDRTRVINVLRKLQKQGFLKVSRDGGRGRAFIFSLNEKGKNYLMSFPKSSNLVSS